jgi:hypothetical protein
MPLVVSAFAIENGPGPQVGSSYSWGRPIMRSTVICASYIHGLSSRMRQTTSTSRAPGAMVRRTLRIAAPGLSQNITPKREKT